MARRAVGRGSVAERTGLVSSLEEGSGGRRPIRAKTYGSGLHGPDPTVILLANSPLCRPREAKMGYAAPKAPYPAKFRTDLVGTLSERRIRHQYQRCSCKASYDRPAGQLCRMISSALIVASASSAADMIVSRTNGWGVAPMFRSRTRCNTPPMISGGASTSTSPHTGNVRGATSPLAESLCDAGLANLTQRAGHRWRIWGSPGVPIGSVRKPAGSVSMVV